MSVEVKAQNTLSMTSVKAIKDATDEANSLLDSMRQSAIDAGTTLDGIYQDAMDAQTSADKAQASADSASEYASRAYANLSTLQSLTETLNWITAHGTMTLTSDVALDPTHIYFVVDAQGDYVVNGTHYAVVTEPDIADIGTYYELSIDESLNNYVATHLAVDSEGLWIIPEANGDKVLIATGSGSTYTTAGTYIIGKENGSDVVLAQFGSTSRIGKASAGNGNVVTGADGMTLRVGTTTVGSLTQIIGYQPEGSTETYNNVLRILASEYFQLASNYKSTGIPKIIMDANANEGVRFYVYDEVEIGGQATVEPVSAFGISGSSTGTVASLAGDIDTTGSTDVGLSVSAYEVATSRDYSPVILGFNNWDNDNRITRGIYDSTLSGWLIGITDNGRLKFAGQPLADFVVAQSESAETSIGTGTWHWREWNSGKVEIWYRGSANLDQTTNAGGLYRRYKRVVFPNSYALYKCSCIVNGTATGGWLNCGGLFNASGQAVDPVTQLEIMAYRISSSPDANQPNVNIYICGEK